MQQELQIAHRLDSVGQLAGGIAHDFNNVLSVIVGYSELAKRQLPGDHAIQHDLNQILAAARRCFDINTHLLSFARKQVMAPRNVSLNEIVSGVGPMFKTLLRENIELTLNLAEDLWPVLVDPGQVEQLLTNLAINARDAMPHGGRLLIETRNISIEADEELPVPNFEPGDYATVSVTDTGMGIPRQHLDRIFEPFFTTKEGRGSGLGLASAYGIAKQAGGRISVYSEPGHGTMFRVYLPRTMGAVEHLADRTIKAPAERGTETVLVAEDNDQVRAVIEQTLKYFGYAVITANSGEGALAKAREYGPGIDLLVTDLIMPRGGGSELAQRLRAERPDLRVIFLSGYTEEAVSAEGVEGIGGAFLQKPVMPSDLAAKVREVLDAQTPANP
jgi:CheY-like chemotaxis protein